MVSASRVDCTTDDGLREYFARCDREIQRLRVAAVSLVSLFPATPLGGVVNELADVYSKVVRRLREAPLSILETGAVEGRLIAWNYAVRTLVTLARRNGSSEPLSEEAAELSARLSEARDGIAAVLSRITEEERARRAGAAQSLVTSMFPNRT